jgi:hypothetical protein
LAVSHGQFFEDRGNSIVLGKKEYPHRDLEVMFWQNRNEVKSTPQIKSESAPLSPDMRPTQEGQAEENRINAKPKPPLSSGTGIEEGKAVRRKKRATDFRQKINKLGKSQSLKP